MKISLSQLEGYPALTLGVRRASFPLASSCLNDYFRAYTIIDFLAKRLVFVNIVTYVPHPGFISESCSRGGKGPISKFKGGHLQLHTFIHTTLVLVNW